MLAAGRAMPCFSIIALALAIADSALLVEAAAVADSEVEMTILDMIVLWIRLGYSRRTPAERLSETMILGMAFLCVDADQQSDLWR